jgi:hypothetical protein
VNYRCFVCPGSEASRTPAEIYNRQLHLTGLASVFMDGADVARIFDQLRPLFDHGFLAPQPGPARQISCHQGRARCCPGGGPVPLRGNWPLQ